MVVLISASNDDPGEHMFGYCGTLPDQNENCGEAVMVNFTHPDIACLGGKCVFIRTLFPQKLISNSRATARKPLKPSAFARLSISDVKEQQRELKKVIPKLPLGLLSNGQYSCAIVT